MRLHDPLVLLLVLLIPVYLWTVARYLRSGGMKYSSVELVKRLKPSMTVRMKNLPIYLRALALVLIIISLARPQKGIEHSKMPTEGIDIVLAVDVSTSMLAEDFSLNGKRANRLDAVKPIIKDFIDERANDRIGMIIFAGRPYTQCPLTLDHKILLQFLDEIKIGMAEDGTAIGSAIGTCVNRLKGLPGKSKIVILLTDGRNNMGKIDPLTSAEVAKAMSIKIYTIGAGGKGLAPYPVQDPFGNKVYTRVPVDIDDDTLKQIAQITGGMYFRATDTETLGDIYDEINRMETFKVEAKIYMEYKELFPLFLIPGFLILILELVLRNTYLRRIP